MSYTIAFNFKDGVTRFIDCEYGETVAVAAYRQRINIPLGCCNGECSTCKSFCESGNFRSGPYLTEALSSEEAKQGYCLPCQMYPETDCVIRIATTSDNCGTRASEFSGEVIASKLISESTIGLSLRVRREECAAFLPGQYVNLQVPGTLATRSYSFSSRPDESVATFLIRNIPGGLMASYLVDKARPGDLILCSGPFGGFYLREISRPILMLAGGTGLAPFLSMLGHLAKAGSVHPIHLVYGVTSDADLVEVETLTSFAQAMTNFTFTTCVANLDSNHPHRGYVTQHVHLDDLHDGEFDVYLCGPPPMVKAARAFFRASNITPVSFYYEKFTPSAGMHDL